MAFVASSEHAPELCKYVIMALPAEIVVMIPAAFMVATEVLLLDQDPPDFDDVSWILLPIHTSDGPDMTTPCLLSIVTGAVGDETHPVVEDVKTNVVFPEEIPVTTPILFTVAIDGLLLTQVPPDDGSNCVVEDIQIVEGPLILTVGVGLTVI